MVKNKNIKKGESVMAIMSKIIEAKMFVKKEKAKFSKLQTAPLSNLMTVVKIKCEKRFGVLFTQKNWEIINE